VLTYKRIPNHSIEKRGQLRARPNILRQGEQLVIVHLI
jgi:hypothetical protein